METTPGKPEKPLPGNKPWGSSAPGSGLRPGALCFRSGAPGALPFGLPHAAQDLFPGEGLSAGGSLKRPEERHFVNLSGGPREVQERDAHRFRPRFGKPGRNHPLYDLRLDPVKPQGQGRHRNTIILMSICQMKLTSRGANACSSG
jgi:hypothetical protein